METETMATGAETLGNDELRQQLQLGFAEILGEFKALRGETDTRFAEVDGEFKALNARSEAREKLLDARFETLDARFEAREKLLDARFETLDARFEAQDQKIEAKFQRMIVTAVLTGLTVFGGVVGVFVQLQDLQKVLQALVTGPTS